MNTMIGEGPYEIKKDNELNDILSDNSNYVSSEQ